MTDSKSAHIVLAHPEAKSFNGTLAGISERELGSAGYKTTLSDLYAMDFDPREGPRHYANRKDNDVFHTQTEQRHGVDSNTLPTEVDAEIQRILDCDLLVVHFPVWWFGMPAILKGWMDRVFVYGRLYRSVMRYDQGICVGKRVIVCVTTGATEDSCSYNGKEGDVQMHLWPLLFPYRYLGFEVYQPEVFHGVGGVAFIEGNEDGLNTLEIYTNRWKETLASLPSRELVRYNHDSEFDERKRLVAGAPVYSPFVRHNPDALGGED